MSHTNSTTHYGLPQWIGSDKPTFLGDFNSAFNTIDTQMKSNADTASGAAETATSANATAISANETAVTADAKATLAKNTADAATSAAESASDLATIAKNTADNAARTAQGNNIANLAPAYDKTRTYSVGDLVTYVDENNSGKLYKCIVAWNTPGDFNINYWDDVTCSDVFSTPDRLFCEVVAASTDTNNTLLQKIVDAGYLNLTLQEKLASYMVWSNNTAYYKYETERARANDVIFERANITDTKIIHDQLTISATPANNKLLENSVDANGFSSSDQSSTSVSGFTVRMYIKSSLPI